ncbi:MAG TPA: class I SAM-dependent methyltransferase [Candidatus Competibacter sp.]|nr:class I SAM-dependent methyltransferase [Candidatus Competibacter sp.]
MSDTFTDHFASVAADYAGFRPTYPAKLFAWLADIAPGRTLAWDCAAGSGQASRDLALHFERVVATDASSAQIAAAMPQPGVEYRVAAAEASGLPDAAVDLVAVAQALHWLDLDRFYAETRRVLKPGGILAVWSYGVLSVEGATANAQVEAFYRDTVGPYWPPERRLVESGYRTLPFPFAEIPAPAFDMEAHWTLSELLGYIRSWSATGRYIAERGHDPVAPLATELSPLWTPPHDRRRVTWPLAVRVGKASPVAGRHNR